ncbi:MAG: D-2-hydroxyacid dehydrogenase [Caldilineaceae bacterium]|nr:D-2-hydroxyacid dehydrogenase [Caldilineaceae bacterium]
MSATPRLTVLIGEDIGPTNLERLRTEFPEVAFHLCLEDVEWLETAPHANVILSKRWPAEAMKRTPELRWVQAGTAGVDHLLRSDLPGRGVLITNSSGAHGDPISELILSHMLAFATGLNALIRAQSERRPMQKEVLKSKFELAEQTLCVIGLGDIGGTLARKASALGMHVTGVRRTARPTPGVSQVYPTEELTTALAQADHVALCLPLTEETRHIVAAAELRAMRPTAYIYNVGRGASIEPDALIQALQTGTIAGAGLDVTDPEPLPTDSPLWSMPNVILSQHTSGSSPHNANRVTELFAANLQRYLAGEALQQQIDPELGY